MPWIHPDHPGCRVRLGFCTNVLPVETLGDLREALVQVAEPLRKRLATGGGTLGVGLHLPAELAAHLAGPKGSADLADLGTFLAEAGLDPFTYNAFPYGGFHRDGLKEGVYRPTWAEPDRERYTLDVARVALALATFRPEGDPLAHLSISTHPGTYGPWVKDGSEFMDCAEAMGRVVSALAQEQGPPVVLSLEAEPFASSPDSASLAEYLSMVRAVAREVFVTGGMSLAEAEAAAARHLVPCLDACHSAVEFEDPSRALDLAMGSGASGSPGGLGKLQFSSALSLSDPAAQAEGRAALLALAEPRYLHQVRGQGPDGPLGVADLPALAAALDEEGPDARAWLACPEWRCHFHVPVDLERVVGLDTTRAHADLLLQGALSRAPHWPTGELHVEVETYTWSVLPSAAQGGGELVDGLERELRHVQALLTAAGWRSA